MPELPEVQTVVTDLYQTIVGQTFQSIKSDWERAVLPNITSFAQLKNKKVIDVVRRGKFIVIVFQKDLFVVIHLRMSGRIIVSEDKQSQFPYGHHRIEFANTLLHFCDSRKFGRVWISDSDNYEQFTGIYKLGIEPFDEQFTYEYFEKLIQKKKGVVKKILLDQSLIAGIGNIYADEACFYCGIRPDSKVENLDQAQKKNLLHSIIKALKQGIENRGTSITNFHDAYGKKGTNQELLYVYGRKGLPCLKCKTSIEKIRLVGRGTAYCPSCQIEY